MAPKSKIARCSNRHYYVLIHHAGRWCCPSPQPAGGSDELGRPRRCRGRSHRRRRRRRHYGRPRLLLGPAVQGAQPRRVRGAGLGPPQGPAQDRGAQDPQRHRRGLPDAARQDHQGQSPHRRRHDHVGLGRQAFGQASAQPQQAPGHQLAFHPAGRVLPHRGPAPLVPHAGMRAVPAPAGEGLQGQRRVAGLPPQGRSQVRSRQRFREGPPPSAAPLRPRRGRWRGRVSRRIRHRDLLQGPLCPGFGSHCQPPGLRRGRIRLRPPPPHRVHRPGQVPHGPVQEPRPGQLGLLTGRRRVGPQPGALARGGWAPSSNR